jgi:PAT family beta-lactamase induction signal transducer AmpG
MLASILMGVERQFALLGRLDTNAGLAAAIGFENMAGGFGGGRRPFLGAVQPRVHCPQYALDSAAASVVGRLVTGTTAGNMIESLGYVNFWCSLRSQLCPELVVLVHDAVWAGRSRTG